MIERASIPNQNIINEFAIKIRLSELIRRHGKIRFLIVCDENLGRSPMFAGAVKKRLENTGLDKYAEVMSAGTDVTEKASDLKYGGKAHPRVRREMRVVHTIDIQDHQVQQLDANMITPNTILVVLNDPEKLPVSVRTKCGYIFKFSCEDPYEADVSLGAALGIFGEHVWANSFALILRLQDAIEADSLETFAGKYENLSSFWTHQYGHTSVEVASP